MRPFSYIYIKFFDSDSELFAVCKKFQKQKAKKLWETQSKKQTSPLKRKRATVTIAERDEIINMIITLFWTEVIMIITRKGSKETKLKSAFMILSYNK